MADEGKTSSKRAQPLTCDLSLRHEIFYIQGCARFEWVHCRTWEPDLLLGPDITGATLGIVGLGRIGQAVARRAKGFDMRILYTSKHRCDPELEQSLGVEFAAFDHLLQESDACHDPYSFV